IVPDLQNKARLHKGSQISAGRELECRLGGRSEGHPGRAERVSTGMRRFLIKEGMSLADSSTVYVAEPLYHLPEKPLVTIEARKSWAPLNLRDLWAHRELLYFLMWRDIKVRYKQTTLGAAWAIIQPLVTMIIFTFFFGKLARVPTEGVPSP